MIERLGEETLPLDGIRVMTQAGGKLSESLAAKFDSYMRAKGGRFYVMYGQTEATARMTVLEPAEMPGRLGSVGRAIPGGQVSVEDGEIVYRGPNVMMGYAASREDLRRGDEMGGVLHTGDQGVADEDGFLFVTGRRQRDANVYGQRLNLDEIEGIMTPKGPSAAISLLERILVFCEWGDDVSLRAYHRELARTLNMHQSALELRRVPKIPVGPNGKADYRLLERMA